MPIEVDEARRLSEIAVATIQVARERGVAAVTIRAVAERLGRSTAVVTHYVPSRAALMINALRHAEDAWNKEIGDLLAAPDLAEADGYRRLAAIARWTCTTKGDDQVLRLLLLEIIGEGPQAGPLVREARRAISQAHHAAIGSSVAAAGIPDPQRAADILHLLFRGYWFAALEDPDSWPAERGAQAALTVLGLLSRQEADAEPD